jgi:hypothetical protein
VSRPLRIWFSSGSTSWSGAGSVGGREQADEPAVHDGNTVPVVPQAAGAHSGHAVARCSIMQPGRHDFRSSLRSSPACRAVPTCRLMPRLKCWYLAQLCSQRERRVPPAVATCAGFHGSRACRRSDHTRCHGGRLVLVGGCHLARDARSSQPVRGLAHRT